MLFPGVAQQQTRQVSGTNNNFEFRVDTSLTGSASGSFIIPSNDTGLVYTWTEVGGAETTGGGTTSAVTAARSDTPIATGITGEVDFVIEAAPGFNNFNFLNSGDKLKFRGIQNWGSTAWDRLDLAFQACHNANIYTATDAPVMTGLTDPTTLKDMFREYGRDTTAGSFPMELAGWDVSSVQKFISMFYNAIGPDLKLTGWAPSSGDDWNFAFYNVTMTDSSALESWDMSNVTKFNGMFYNFKNGVDTSNWNTSSATNMDNMFRHANNTQDTANLDIAYTNFDMSGVTTASNMFFGVTLSEARYGELLVALDGQTLQSGVAFHGGNATLTNPTYTTARTSLEGAPDLWVITDGDG